MSKNYSHIDSHKLHYHPVRLAKWYKGEHISPILVELGPINNCNYRCSFCAFDYTGYGGRILPEKILFDLIDDLAACGVKSIVFAGTGEPLMYKSLPEAIQIAADKGVDVGLSTNGYFLNPEKAKKILPYLSWIRFSFNAGTPKSYSEIHGCKPIAFQRVIDNISACTEIKREMGLPVTLGMQSLILSKNQEESLLIAVLSRDIGVDYFALKPFSPHPLSINDNIKETQLFLNPELLRDLEALSRENFQVIVRNNAIRALSTRKNYSTCYSLPFACYIEADGNIYACNSFVGDEEASYGNLNDATFLKIWNSSIARSTMEKLSSMNHGKCRQACRMDSINNYLWGIKNPPDHKNFI